MDRHTLQLLGYEELLEALAGLARSEPGARRLLSLKPDLTPETIRLSWRLIDEAKSAIGLEGLPPLDMLADVDDLTERLHVEGVVLNPAELIRLYHVLRTSRLVRDYILKLNQFLQSQAGTGLILLMERGLELPVFRELETALDRTFGPEGEVLDTASPELARTRREASGLRGTIQHRLNDFMRAMEPRGVIQDQIVTTRNGRYVIPVKAGGRGDVPGLVHDYSGSGATAYVEPLEMVEDNNRLNFLRRREKEEIVKILKSLSARMAEVRSDIDAASELLTELDAVFAQASLSRMLHCRAPLLEEENGVDLKEAYHPLLLIRAIDRKARQGADDPFASVVPLGLTLDPRRRTLVISGINAGGKTVALKTLGLLTLMAQTGLHLPVGKGSRIGFFERIMAVIGDEQDMQSDLSTFSGHIRRLSWVLESADRHALVLMDELGTGTDPSEGAALALAMLDELTRRQVWTVTATHYHALKAWAHLTEGVENASVRTNEHGRPVFGLHYGAPGFSSGLATARELGLDPEVVARAESYLDEGQKRTLELMQKLEEERARLAKTRTEVEGLEEELAAALAASSAAEKKRAAAHVETLSALQKDVKSAISKAEREFRGLRGQIKDQPRSLGEMSNAFRQAKSELMATVPEPPRPRAALKSVSQGDLVRVESLGRQGVVVSVDPVRKKAVIDLNGMTVTTDWKKLTPADQQNARSQARGPMASYPVIQSAPSELNLIGQTVEDALSVLERSLDHVFLSGMRDFMVIHGIGTGRLRQAVRDYLKDDSRVKAFRPGEPNIGGEGVTVVSLAD